MDYSSFCYPETIYVNYKNRNLRGRRVYIKLNIRIKTKGGINKFVKGANYRLRWVNMSRE